MNQHPVNNLVFGCILLAGCSSRLVDIDDPRAVIEAAAELPGLFGVAEGETAAIYLPPNPDASDTPEFVTVEGQDVIEEIPESILNLNPKDILITTELVVIQLRGGGIASHEAVCIFLASDENRKSRVVQELKLKRLDNKGEIYQYVLYDFRMILNRWDTEHPNASE